MTIEEVYHILETEKFCKTFNKSSLLKKINLIRMRKIYSMYFRIPENILYLNQNYFNFFSLYINNKSNFDINQIKLDIINNVPIVDICLTYSEPEEVIEEIKNNINSVIDIISNKIYTIKELSPIFNLTPCGVFSNKFLLKNRVTDGKTNNIFWIGKDIKNIIGTDVKLKKDETTLNNVPLISLSKLAKTLKINHDSLLGRITKKYKIFGHIIELIGDKKQYFITKELYNKIVSNKKYYISIEEANMDEKIDYTITSYYKLIYGKELNLTAGFIKKENVMKLNDLLKFKEDDFCGFIDNLYNNIDLSNNDIYDLDVLLRTYCNNNKRTKSMLLNNLGISSNIIDKKTALEVMLFMNKRSIRYIQTKKQKETPDYKLLYAVKRENRRYDNVKYYIDCLQKKYLNLNIIKLDLFYKNCTNVSTKKIIHNIDRLLLNRRNNCMFDGNIGYILKGVYDKFKNLKITIFLFWDQNKNIDTITMGDNIGKYWSEIITKNTGSFYNHNKDNFNIDTLIHNDVEKRMELDKIMILLIKEDNALKQDNNIVDIRKGVVV